MVIMVDLKTSLNTWVLLTADPGGERREGLLSRRHLQLKAKSVGTAGQQR